MSEERCYYIIDARVVVGNCAMLWREGGQGYTCDVNDAGLFTEAEAKKEHANRGTDIPVHRDALASCLRTHLRRDMLFGASPQFADHMRAAQEIINPPPAGLSEHDLKYFLELDPFDGERDLLHCDTLRDGIVTAAKDHACHECSGGSIAKGQRHRCRVETEPGQPATSYRWCHDCTREHLLRTY